MGSDGGGDRMDLDNRGGDRMDLDNGGGELQKREEGDMGVVEWEELGRHPHISQQRDMGEDAAAKGPEDAISLFMKVNQVTKTHKKCLSQVQGLNQVQGTEMIFMNIYGCLNFTCVGFESSVGTLLRFFQIYMVPQISECVGFHAQTKGAKWLKLEPSAPRALLSFF